MLTVKVRPFFEVREVVGESRLEIKVKEGTTVKELLRQLVRSYGSRFEKMLFDPETEKIKPFYRILLGGRDISQFKEGMDTPLKDNDVVSISLIPYGGG